MRLVCVTEEDEEAARESNVHSEITAQLRRLGAMISQAAGDGCIDDIGAAPCARILADDDLVQHFTRLCFNESDSSRRFDDEALEELLFRVKQSVRSDEERSRRLYGCEDPRRLVACTASVEDLVEGLPEKQDIKQLLTHALDPAKFCTSLGASERYEHSLR